MKNTSMVAIVWGAIIVVGLIAALVSASSELRGEGSRAGSRARAALPSGPASAEEKPGMQKATFGAGCFWGVEEVFRKLEGVVDTEVGYMGGTVENPTYQQVCSNTTGHAEVCEVSFDPAKISYTKLLETFWKLHDPTQVNRQGPDVGQQYRSVIFYHSPEQKAAAEADRERLGKSGEYGRPIATAIEEARTFWAAEDYHQRYFEKRGGGACRLPGK